MLSSLYIAANLGNAEVVKALLDNGADHRIGDACPLTHAKDEKIGMVAFLISELIIQQYFVPLCKAIKTGSFANLVEKFLKCGGPDSPITSKAT